MCKSNAPLLFVLALLGLSGGAHAATGIRVLATYPASDTVTLGKGQTFYLRLGYTIDEPVQIWARPFFQGREVKAGSNPSRTYSGEALGWRVAAAVPAAIVGFVVLRIIFDTAADPKSHNLWPFEILQVGVLSLVVLGALAAARKFSGAAA